jgi:hypothetical protein
MTTVSFDEFRFQGGDYWNVKYFLLLPNSDTDSETLPVLYKMDIDGFSRG